MTYDHWGPKFVLKEDDIVTYYVTLCYVERFRKTLHMCRAEWKIRQDRKNKTNPRILEYPTKLHE